MYENFILNYYGLDWLIQLLYQRVYILFQISVTGPQIKSGGFHDDRCGCFSIYLYIMSYCYMAACNDVKKLFQGRGEG